MQAETGIREQTGEAIAEAISMRSMADGMRTQSANSQAHSLLFGHPVNSPDYPFRVAEDPPGFPADDLLSISLTNHPHLPESLFISHR